MRRYVIFIFVFFVLSIFLLGVSFYFVNGDSGGFQKKVKVTNEVSEIVGKENKNKVIDYDFLTFSPLNQCVSGSPNGIIETGEECDPLNFNSYTGLCSNYSSSYTFGSWMCTSYCTIDASSCSPGTCGNGICEVRTESHFDCPVDCTGNYSVIDGNNPSCSNSGAGNLTQPFCGLTYSKFLQLNPGESVYFRNGEQHIEGTWSFWDRDGAPGEFITFRNYPGENPVIEKGKKINDVWVNVGSVGTQNIWKANSSFGSAFFNETTGRVTNYPGLFMRGVERPLSALLNYQNLTSVLSVPFSGDSFEAYYINCSDGFLYIRIDSSVNPNSEGVYYSYNQMQGNYSYLRFKGLTLQHAGEGFKTNSFSSSYNQYLDNKIRSVQLGIEDTNGGGRNLLIQNNSFSGIAPLMYVEPTGGGGEHEYWWCEGETGLGNYKYHQNNLDHINYGAAQRVELSYNSADADGIEAGVRVNSGYKIFSNNINSTIYSRGVSNAEIFNNIFRNSKFYAADFEGTVSNLKVYNNIFVGSNYNNNLQSIVGFLYHSSAPSAKFYNNIIVNSDSSRNPYCVSFFNSQNPASSYLPLTGYEFNNNIYVNCSSWLSLSQSLNNVIQNNISAWQSFAAGNLSQNGIDNESFVATSDEVFANFGAGNYYHKNSGAAIDKGVMFNNLSFDFLDKVRPVDIFGVGVDGEVLRSYDIGPYEYQFPTCSDGIQNQGETGVDCGGSCAACGGGKNGGGNGGGGSGGGGSFVGGNVVANNNQIVCSSLWNCGEWSVCENGERFRSCEDERNCNLNLNKPAEKEECEEKNETIRLSPITGSAIGDLDSAGGILGKVGTVGVLLIFYLVILIFVIRLSIKRNRLYKKIQTDSVNESDNLRKES